MKIALVTQARIGSTRFPSKILQEINKKSLLEIHLERAKQSKKPNIFIVASTFEKDSKKIAEIANRCGWGFFQGSLENVLERFYFAVLPYKPDYVVRITSDCPLIDSKLIDEAIQLIIDNNVDYVSNTIETTYPDGMDVEVMKFSALKKSFMNAKLNSEKEHVTPYIWKNTNFFKKNSFKAKSLLNNEDFSNIRLTVDYPADLQVIDLLISEFGYASGWETYSRFIQNVQLSTTNLKFMRNSGYFNSVANEST